MVLLDQFGVELEGTLLENLLEILEHTFADTGDGEDFLGFGDDVGDLLGIAFNGVGGVAVGSDTKGVVAIDFHEIGSFVEDSGDAFVVDESIVHAKFPEKILAQRSACASEARAEKPSQGAGFENSLSEWATRLC